MLRFIGTWLPRQSSAVSVPLKRVDFLHRSLTTSLLHKVSRRFASELQRPTKSGKFRRRTLLWQGRLPQPLGYPGRLLIYHAGTGKTVFIGCLKLTTIFLFSFSCLVLAPSLYYAPDRPNWAAVLGQSCSLSGRKEDNDLNNVL